MLLFSSVQLNYRVCGELNDSSTVSEGEISLSIYEWVYGMDGRTVCPILQLSMD